MDSTVSPIAVARAPTTITDARITHMTSLSEAFEKNLEK